MPSPKQIAGLADWLRRLRDVAFRLRSWRRGQLGGPKVVQVQTLARCNAACALCPNAQRDNSGPPQVMSDELFDRLLVQLRDAKTVRLFTLMLQNEPLLDPDLPAKVRRALGVLGPDVLIDTVTNGALLAPERADALIEAGIGRIGVSIDALSPETYARVRPGLPFDRVVANTEALLARTERPEVCARMLRQPANLHEESGFRRYWGSRGALVWVNDPTNRAGALADMSAPPPGRRERLRDAAKKLLRPLFPPCREPFQSLNVLADGRVLLCCQDWNASTPMGDLSRQLLDEVWNGPTMNRQRKLLARWRWEDSEVCAGCSVVCRLRS
jgi:MoaA/NifB/PqqE/SkfB family radical SAM enzyme